MIVNSYKIYIIIFKLIIKLLNILSELSFTFNFLPFPSVALQ